MDTNIIFVAFKGNDIHSGFAPSADPLIFESWMQELGLDANDVSQINYISYPSKAACSRHTTHSISPPLTFGNGGA